MKKEKQTGNKPELNLVSVPETMTFEEYKKYISDFYKALTGKEAEMTEEEWRAEYEEFIKE